MAAVVLDHCRHRLKYVYLRKEDQAHSTAYLSLQTLYYFRSYSIFSHKVQFESEIAKLLDFHRF